MPVAPLTLLVDNGSLEPAATFALRALAAKLSTRLGQTVEPVSLLHSSGIDPARLGGQPAELLFPAMEKRLGAGRNDFVILPLFLGPSRALTEYLPENLARLQARFPTLYAPVAAPLHDARDDRLARILADHVRSEIGARSAEPVRVALVDHGSPVATVTAVRNELARRLSEQLGPAVAAVAPSSMERRPEPVYDFNDPLLARLLETQPWSEGRVIVAMQFLLPGRHAGPTGDVTTICQKAERRHPLLRTRITKLIGEHPLLLEILADRWQAAR